MSRYIDADNLPRHGNRGGVVYWRDIEAQPTVDVVKVDKAQKEIDYWHDKAQSYEQTILKLSLNKAEDAVEVIRCKDCRHFEYDHPYIIQGVPVLGHEVCNAWGDGCKTDENGYCFMAERRTDDLQ